MVVGRLVAKAPAFGRQSRIADRDRSDCRPRVAVSDGRDGGVRGGLIVVTPDAMGGGLYGGGAAMYLAAQNGHESVVGRLITARAVVDTAMTDGTTPLHVAAQDGHEAVVGRLIAVGAAVGLPSSAGLFRSFKKYYYA